MERVIVWHRWCPSSESSREAASLGLHWRAAARERFARAEATVLLELGGSAVFALAPERLDRAIELCLTAVRDAEREESVTSGVACGIALGRVQEAEPGGTGHTGEALDRAQALAHAAEPNQIVLDAPAQSAASGTFLFAREVRVSSGLGGAVLDRAFPRQSDCQRAVAHLGRQPFPVNGSTQFESLRRVAKSTGRHRVLLVGPHGIGIGLWLARIAGELAPPVWLDVRALGASLAPLSGLMHALRRLPTSASPEHVLVRPDALDQGAQATLAAIRAGRAVSRRDAIVALRQYLGRVGEGGKRALITVDPTPLIDPSSVGVVAEAAREGGPDALFVMRLLLDSKPPEAFARGGGLAEIRVRGLSLHEARSLATNMLTVGSALGVDARGAASPTGYDMLADVARRAVAMGGSNPLAVATALRVLVASGDVVFDPVLAPSSQANNNDASAQVGAFRWRRGPAGRLEAMTLEALLEARLDALAPPLRRVLEVLICVPDPDDRELTSAVVRADGVVEELWVRALEELELLALVRCDARGIGISPALRQVVQATMTTARGLELHGNIALALERRLGAHDEFARATLAYYLANAGRMSEAAAIFLDVAQCAGRHGFVRSGVRLAAAAVECDPSLATRLRAAELAEQLSERWATSKRPSSPSTEGRPSGVPESTETRVAPSTPADLAKQASAQAVRAILARDFDGVDRALELLIAAGHDSASVDRLRTVMALAKGDHAGAHALLERHRDAGDHSPRLSLTSALVSVAAGEVPLALRTCLATLARTREARDLAGERAALCVMAMCYRRLGRDADATRLATAALTATPPRRAHA